MMDSALAIMLRWVKATGFGSPVVPVRTARRLSRRRWVRRRVAEAWPPTSRRRRGRRAEQPPWSDAPGRAAAYPSNDRRGRPPHLAVYVFRSSRTEPNRRIQRRGHSAGEQDPRGVEVDGGGQDQRDSVTRFDITLRKPPATPARRAPRVDTRSPCPGASETEAQWADSRRNGAPRSAS